MADYCSPVVCECISRIKNEVSKDILYENLAEEASELAQAALKMVRVNNPDNPTPVSEKEALDNLIEEYTDVLNTAKRILDLEPNWMLGDLKLMRWVKRLDASKHGECDDSCPI